MVMSFGMSLLLRTFCGPISCGHSIEPTSFFLSFMLVNLTDIQTTEHILEFWITLLKTNLIFKASALWSDAFYKSKCQSVCPSVCSLLRYCLNVFLPPIPEVGCSIFLEIRNPWGKSNGKKGSKIWTFLFGSGLKSLRYKKKNLLLILPYKTWWKQHFLKD